MEGMNLTHKGKPVTSAVARQVVTPGETGVVP